MLEDKKIFQELTRLTLRFTILLNGMAFGILIQPLFRFMIPFLQMNMMLGQNYGSKLNHLPYQ